MNTGGARVAVAGRARQWTILSSLSRDEVRILPAADDATDRDVHCNPDEGKTT
jgi:hypothetical protein